MNSNAAIISYLQSIFRGKRIGLIWDKPQQSFCDEVVQFIERCNADKATKTKIVLELVDEGLTPIIQVPDVAVNKIFKALVKQKYHVYRSGLDMKIGGVESVPRKTLVDVVLDAIAEINDQNFETHYIMDTFKCCGLNPWSQQKSLEAFREHLDWLEANKVLKAMLANQKALSLT
jgi:hypothetical protein